MDGKNSVFKKEAADGPVGDQGSLRTIFCDGGHEPSPDLRADKVSTFSTTAGESHLKSPAQLAATKECQHPRQDPVESHKAFEPYGMN